MRNDGWKVEKQGPTVAPKIASTPAKNYSRPEISKVSVFLEVDSPEFAPSSNGLDGSALIFANIPDGTLVLPRGGTKVVDCGFTVSVPAGYRCRVSSNLHGVILEAVDSKRFKVNVINLGDETTLNNRDAIGRLWVEPVYFFEWITRL